MLTAEQRLERTARETALWKSYNAERLEALSFVLVDQAPRRWRDDSLVGYVVRVDPVSNEETWARMSVGACCPVI